MDLEEVLGDITQYGGDLAEVFELDSANQSLLNTAESLSNLQAQLRNSIDLFNQFQAAQSSSNPSDNYNTITSAAEGAKKLWDQGWVGKDDFTSFAQLIAPNGTSMEDAIKNFETNYTHVKKYLTEETVNYCISNRYTL